MSKLKENDAAWQQNVSELNEKDAICQQGVSEVKEEHAAWKREVRELKEKESAWQHKLSELKGNGRSLVTSLPKFKEKELKIKQKALEAAKKKAGVDEKSCLWLRGEASGRGKLGYVWTSFQ